MAQALLDRKTAQLHAQLRERLRADLQSCGPGHKVPPERELAKRFGVAPMTVARALNELQQEGFLQRIPGKGTFLSDLTGEGADSAPAREPQALSPNLMARSGSPMGGTAPAPALNAWILLQAVEIFGHRETNEELWLHRVASQLERGIQAGGGQARIRACHEHSEADIERAWQEALAAGVNSIFCIFDERNSTFDVWTELFAHYQTEANSTGTRLPVITQIVFSGTASQFFDTVSFDGEWGSYLATSHLLHLGHRRIAFLAPDLPYEWLIYRIRGFHRALRGFGIPVARNDTSFGVLRIPVEERTGMWDRMGHLAVERLQTEPAVTGIVAVNDKFASAFITNLRQQGQAVPETLSVVGYDDWIFSGQEGLTTIHPPIDSLAGEALALAKRRLQEAVTNGHTHIVLKPHLMVRGTTRAVEGISDS